jgi:hypothetical protein
MRNKTYQVTMDIKVFDEDALFEQAKSHAIATGTEEADAIDLLKPAGEIDITACLIMLLDPGVSPSGIEIQETTVERY